jgi:hypothetical protein
LELLEGGYAIEEDNHAGLVAVEVMEGILLPFWWWGDRTRREALDMANGTF